MVFVLNTTVVYTYNNTVINESTG